VGLVEVDDLAGHRSFPVAAVAVAAAFAVTVGVRSPAVVVVVVVVVPIAAAVAVAVAAVVSDHLESKRTVNNPTTLGVVDGRSGHRRLVGKLGGSVQRDCRRGSSRFLVVGGAAGRFDGVVAGRMALVFVEVEVVEVPIAGIVDTLMRMEGVVGIGRVVEQRLIVGAFDRMVYGFGVEERPLDRGDEIAEAAGFVEVGIDTALVHWVVAYLEFASGREDLWRLGE